MRPAATLPDPADEGAAQRREADAHHYRAMLHELADMGMDIARALHRQATQENTAQPSPEPAAAPAPQPAPDLTVAFERIARTVRRTVALARTLDEPAAQPRRAAETAPHQQHERVAARARILRDVEDVIQRRAEGAEADSLRDELYERLADAPDLDQDLASRPIADVIQTLLRDLGIAATFPGNRPWQRRTPADVRDLRARAARLAGVIEPADRPGTAQPTAAAPPPARPRTNTGPPPH